MEEIIKDLRLIRDKVEKMDDPTSSSDYRVMIGDAHYFIEECISKLEEL